MTTPSDFEKICEMVMMISYADSFPEFLLKLTKDNKLKVRLSQNEFMKSSIFQKMTLKI